MKKSTDLPISELVLVKTNQFIAFNKPAGLPVQDDKTGDKALLNLAEIYTKGQVLLTHRIDRPASGVVLFAKTKNALAAINAPAAGTFAASVTSALVSMPANFVASADG